MNEDGNAGGVLLYLICVAFFAVSFGAIGAWLGNRYHGQPLMGFAAGLMCGPIGLLLMFLLPSEGFERVEREYCRFCKSGLNRGATVCHKCGRDQQSVQSNR